MIDDYDDMYDVSADNDGVLFRLLRFRFSNVHTFGYFPTSGTPDIKQLASGTTVVI